MLWNVEGQTFSGEVFISLNLMYCAFGVIQLFCEMLLYFVTIVNASFCTAMYSPMAFCSKFTRLSESLSNTVSLV